jgi:hypothetical protein
MAIPALNNGVTLYAAITNRLPLFAADKETGEKLERSRSNPWLETLDPNYPVGLTKAKTLTDLIFNQVSFWRVLSYNAQGFPATSEHIDLTRIQVIPPSKDNPQGGIKIDGQDVNLDDIIRFDGITDGLLLSCQESLLMAYNNVKAASRYASKPMPAWLLTDSDPTADPLTVEQAEQYLTSMDAAVANRGSGYAGGVKPESLSWNAREIQLVEARQADAVDMARLLCMPTRYVSAPAQGAELTYANLADVRRDLIESGGLSTYLTVIEQRLSMPDCTPSTQVVKFDSDSFFSQVVEQPNTPGGQELPALSPVTPIAAGRRVLAREVTAMHDHTLGEGLSRVTATDTERRIIEGLIVPWNEVGYASLDGTPQTLLFAGEGSLTWEGDPPDIPLVINHTGSAPVFAGRCVEVWADDAGLWGRWKILDTRNGDEALAEAQAELRSGLSLEALIPQESIIDPDSGILTVTADHPALLERTALVDRPAFNKAGVSRAVAAETKAAAAAEVPDESLAATIAALNDAVQGLTGVATDLQNSLAENAGLDEPAEEAPMAASRPNPAGGAATAVTREPFPYGHPGADGQSFFKDLYAMQRDANKETGRAAAQRVEKAHSQWQELGQARVDAGMSRGGARLATAAGEPIPQANVFVPNQYDIGLYVEQLTFERKLVDRSPKTTISGPNPFLYPKFVSSLADGGSGEPVTAHTEGTNPVTGELDIDAITATPLPYSGTFDINREAVDGASPGMDQILFGALGESYNQVTELAAWTALYAASGITSPTSVTSDADLAVEARLMEAQIRSEQAAFDVRRGIGPDYIYFGAGVWSAALSSNSTATSGEPLYPYYNPTNRDGRSTNNGVVGIDIRGVPGESAKQATSAKVTQLRHADLHVWEGNAGLFRWEEVVGPAKLRFSLFNYFVFKVVQPLGVTVHTQA